MGGVAPRPAVGAVVVLNGVVVGEGATEPRPGQHAEAMAIAQFSDSIAQHLMDKNV